MKMINGWTEVTEKSEEARYENMNNYRIIQVQYC